MFQILDRNGVHSILTSFVRVLILLRQVGGKQVLLALERQRRSGIVLHQILMGFDLCQLKPNLLICLIMFHVAAELIFLLA